MQNENSLNQFFFEDEPVNYRASMEKYFYHWKWFVLGLFIALTGAYIYLRYANNIYEVSTTIIIDDKEGGGLNSELSAFKDLGILGDQKTSLETEITVLKSRSLMQRVARQLELNVTFHHKGRVSVNEIYQRHAPYKITFLNKDSLFYHLDTSFTILTRSASTYALLDSEGERLKEWDFGTIIDTQLGKMIVTPANIEKIIVGEESLVKISPLKAVASHYEKKLNIAPASKKSNALVLRLKDPIKIKAQVILNDLVRQYNLDAIEDKSLVARNTDKFITQRIEDITTDMENVDKGVEVYKTENKLTDIGFEAGLVLQSGSELQKRIVDLTAQIKLIDYVSAYMKNNKEDLIPANLGLKDEMTSQGTLNYNMLLLERNRILMSSSKMNPTVINLEAQIATLRASIDQSLVNLRSSLAISLNEAKLQEKRLDTKRSIAPRQEREFQDIKRRQLIIETLYLYLLQKREENAITLAATAPNAKVIDRADGSDIPVSPNKRTIYMIAALLGLITPFIILYIQFLLDNKIHTVEDVETVVKAPVLGDIPNAGDDKKVVIKATDTSHLSEAFRLLRTNLDFMLTSKAGESKTIFVTSTVGNEGKTFIAINLAIALKLLNKKVLLVGGDVRKPKIAKYLDLTIDKGLTHFLTYRDLKVDEIIVHDKKTDLDIIQSGEIPPNPSELLNNGRFEEIMEYGRANYDYIIVDTAPVNIVTDTLLLGHFADLFIYVIRANYLDKRMLKIPQMMYENKRLPNMAVLINDTDYEKKGYGYGYGYGYAYSEKEIKKSWWKKG